MHNQLSNSLPAPEIVLETDRILAVCKPGGLLTQAPSGIDSMEVRVKRYLAQQTGNTGKVYLGVPHRLDRPASGAMVFARDKKAARFLAEQFQQRRVRKIYQALVSGTVQPDRGTWTDWMRKIPDEARSEICREDTDGAQSAVLHYHRVAERGGLSLLSIQLETGRSHQIRLQSGSRGYPILGDELYGSTTAYGPQSDDVRLRWIALHARRLEIVDPASEKLLQIVAEVSEHWPMHAP